MNKGLTPLKHLEFIRNYEIDDEHRTLNMNYACKQSFGIIEAELKRLELLEKEHNRLLYDYEDLVHCGLKEEQKKLKALEIIKEKRVNMDALIHAIYVFVGDYALFHYNAFYGNEIVINGKKQPSRELTQEEFDLLKEVLL